ncbi:MAG: PQQ-binding-like beta-propeller repeat protein [Polyangiaceae bacterium]|nr:PQQ-binding-like beta-propeller repeat protein [Polyangiaceae bacterium]
MPSLPRLRLRLPLVACLLLGAAACAPPAPRAMVADGRIAVQQGIRKSLHLIDAGTGAAVSLPAGGWSDAPAAKKGLVFTHGAGGLVARDLTTGEVKWRVLMKMSYLARVVPTQKVVFVPYFAHVDLLGGTETGWVALDVEKGQRVYEVRADRFAPLAANDDVVVTIENGELVGYSVSDGKERWRSTVKASGPLTIEDNRVYARSEDQLAIFTAASGALQRRVDLGGTDAFRWFRTPFVVKGNTIAWIDSSVLSVADATTGKPLWKREGVEDLAIASGLVIASRDDQLEGLDLATGASKWKVAINHDSASLSAGGDVIVARVETDEVAVLDAATGKQRFVFDLETGKKR